MQRRHQAAALTATLLLALVVAAQLTTAALLESYDADAIDARPSGRTRHDLLCFAERQSFYTASEDVVVILGGESEAEPFSADFNRYVVGSDSWKEDSKNRATFAPRHSAVTQPLSLVQIPDMWLVSFGGFQSGDSGPFVSGAVNARYMGPSDARESGSLESGWSTPFALVTIGPGPRARAASWVFGSTMYVYGGITADGVIKGDVWSLELLDAASSFVWTPRFVPFELPVSEDDLYRIAADDGYGGASFAGYTGEGNFPTRPPGSGSGSGSGGLFPPPPTPPPAAARAMADDTAMMMEDREAMAQAPPPQFIFDDKLRRYGACCAAIGATEALCFGGTGLTSDYRSVLIFREGVFGFLEFVTTNPNDGPDSVRDASCTFNSRLNAFIVFGGYDSRKAGASLDTKMYFLDVATGTWSSVQQPNFDPVYGHKMCTTSSNATYMFGGKAAFLPNATLWQLSAGTRELELIGDPVPKLPLERSHHWAGVVGTSFYVGFGRSPTRAYNDIWQYDVSTGTWTKQSRGVSTAGTVVAGRWGSSAAVFGPSIFVFGGRMSLTLYDCSADLYVFETARQLLSLVAVAGTSPPARSNHVSFVSGTDIVVGLGRDALGKFLDDWYAFSPVTQSWRRLLVDGNAISARDGASAVQSYNETYSLVGLGFGGASNRDWYFVRVAGNTLVSRRVPINETMLEARTARRAFASVAGRGRHVLVCGGVQTDDIASPPDGRCYQLDMAAGLVGLSGNQSTPDELGLVGAPSVYVKDSIFTFGGRIITDPGVSDVYYKRTLRTRPSATCNVTGPAPDDSRCSLCGFGSSGVNCQFTAAGFYTTVSGNTVGCSAGTYSPTRGGASNAVCVPCPFGTFANGTGRAACFACNTSLEFCAVGSAIAESRSSARAVQLTEPIPATGVVFEANPVAYVSPSLPWFPVGIIAGSAIFLGGVVAFVLYMSARAYGEFEAYYLTPAVAHKLSRIFIKRAFEGREMSLAQLIAVFRDLNFEPHVSSSLLQQTFFDQVEDSGSETIDVTDFKRCFIDLIKIGIIPPFAGSRAESEGRVMPAGGCVQLFEGIKLAQIDGFMSKHVPAKLGKIRRCRQTRYGGVLTLLLWVTQVIIVLAVITSFLYSNVQEVKAIVPHPVVQALFGATVGEVSSDMSVEVAVTGPVREDPLLFAPSDTQVDRSRKVCLANEVQGQCNNATAIAVSGVIVRNGGFVTKRCTFDPELQLCRVSWHCVSCTVTLSAELLFTFSPKRSASRLNVALTTSSGIREPLQFPTGQLKIAGGENLRSTLRLATRPREEAKVLSGFPATEFSFGLVPTYFVSVELHHLIFPTDLPVLGGGYHARPGPEPVPGNAITPEFFGTFFDCPVRVKLSTDADIMLVERSFIASMVDLLTNLLGAVSGVAGAFLSVTKWIDGYEGSHAVDLDEEGEDLGGGSDADDIGGDNNDFKGAGESSAFAQVASMSYSPGDDGSRRVLDLVRLGMRVDLALKAHKIISSDAPLPAAGCAFDLATRQAESAKAAPVTLDRVADDHVEVPVGDTDDGESSTGSEVEREPAEHGDDVANGQATCDSAEPTAE